MNRKKREQLILDAAIKVFANNGYGKTSVSEIIDSADVARGTFYLYFKNKTDIFNALLDRFFVEILQAISRKYTTQNEIEGIPHYREMASNLITTLMRNKLLLKLVLVSAHEFDGEFEGKFRVFYEQLTQVMTRNIDQKVRAGLFRPCSPKVVAQCLVGSVKEILTQWILDNNFEIEETIQGTIDYLLNGVRIQSVREEIIVSDTPKVVAQFKPQSVH